MEIHALKAQYLAQGSRTDIIDQSSYSANITKGWQQKVRDELGISDDTAYRIMERAQSVVYMHKLEIGETVEYIDAHSKQPRVIESTPETRDLATKALESVVSGTVAAPRAWAGLVGEATRRAKQGGSASRAATDHGSNLMRAIIALHNSLQQWKHISLEERIEIEKRWQSVLARLPETMRP
jgi:hypothetical protein